MIKLRDYQIKLKQDIYDHWSAGFRNVVAVSPTGSGKAMTLCTLAQELAHQHGMPTAIKVHRQELVEQLCMTLAQLGIYHNIIAQKNTILGIIQAQRKEYGKSFYEHRSPITVISVDTLVARADKYKTWAEQVRVWILDEAAHQLKTNKWGRAADMFPNALGVGFTATPQRLDKKGLGRHAFGLFDAMIMGPTVRWLISQGYLASYRIAVPESDYRQYLKDSGNDSTDYTQQARNYASMHSHIVGDVIESYKRHLSGKQAILFADSIEAGEKYENAFLEAGISAKLLTGDTPAAERRKGVNDFRDRKIKVLINVDLFDEGFDVPGVDGVIMARPTKSIGKFLQCCGRALRPVYAKGFDLSTAEGRIAAQKAGPKPYAVIIDHVGNIAFGRKAGHGLPDKIRQWTLDNIVNRRDTVNLLRICMNVKCNSPFDRALDACPNCGCTDKPYRSSGEKSPREALIEVDGDMELLDPETIRHLEREVELEDPYEMEARITRTVGKAAGIHARKNQQARIEMQKQLADVIALWCGRQKHYGYTDRQIKKRFANFFGEGITVVLSLPRSEMEQYMEQIKRHIGGEE